MKTRRLKEVSWKEKDSEINEKLKDIEAKEKQLNSKEDELECQNKKLGEIFRGLEAGKEKLALREKQFQGRWRELELYAVEIEEDRDKVADQLRELELRDVQFKERMEELESSRTKDMIEGQRKEQFERIRTEQLEADGNKLEERIHEVDRKEKQLAGKAKSLDLLSKDLARKRQELESNKRKIEADSKKLDERVKGFDLRSKDLERQHKELESNQRKIKADWKILDERIREADHKEWRLDRGLSDLKMEQKELESNKRKLEADRKKLEEQFNEVNRKEWQLDGGLEVLEIGNKDLGRQHKELESDKSKFEADRKKLDGQLLEIELNAKKSDDSVKELELKRKELEGQFRKLESDKKEFKVDREKLDDRFREIEIKIKKFQENSQELESSKIELGGRRKQVKLKENWLDLKSKEIELKGNKYEKLCKEIVMDGKTLQIFLNECWRDHEKMGDEVSVLLRLSQDPAKLVLDGLEGFFPPHLRNGDIEFAGNIVQGSSILLLEQLLKISHDIKLKPDVKYEARRLSSTWITKLKADGEHFTEILGFLLVLANYDLTSNFDVDELFNYVKTVAHCEQVPDLCRLLGMTDKIPGLIQDLIERKQHLVAIRYAFAFNLVEQFHPDSLLKDHIETSKTVSAVIIENGNTSPETQSQATARKIADLRAAISCIENYNLSSEYSPANLRQVIASLEKHQAKQTEAPAAASNAPQQQQTGTDFSDAAIPRNDLPDGLVDVSPIESEYQHHAVISTEDPLMKRRKLSYGKSISTENADSKPEEVCGGFLRGLLDQNVDFSLVRDKVVEILQSSPNPSVSVYHAMKSFLSTYSSGGICRIKWCISLLKEFKDVSHTIEVYTLEEARELATSWKLILTGKKCDHMEIACFLLFLDAYQLSSYIKARAVTPLINSLDCPKELHYYFEQIGMPNFLPDYVKSLIAKNHHIQAIKYIHALELVGMFQMVALIDDHLAYWNKVADERYHKGPNLSAHPQMEDINLRLDAVKSVIMVARDCELQSKYPIRQLEETMNELIRLQRGAIVGAEHQLKRKSSSLEEEDRIKEDVASSGNASSKKPQHSSVVSSFPKSPPTSKNCRSRRWKRKWQQQGRKQLSRSQSWNEPPFEENYHRVGFAPPPPPWVSFRPPPPPNQFDLLHHVGGGFHHDRGYGGYVEWCDFPGLCPGPYHGLM